MNRTPEDDTAVPRPRGADAGEPVGPRGELVDLQRGPGETIRTLELRPLPDGSGNDSPVPDEKPDAGTEKCDAG